MANVNNFKATIIKTFKQAGHNPIIKKSHPQFTKFSPRILSSKLDKEIIIRSMANINNFKATIIKTFIREGKEYNYYKDIFEVNKIDLKHKLSRVGKKNWKKYIYKANGIKNFVEISKKLHGEVQKETDGTAISGKLNKIVSLLDRDEDDCNQVDSFIDDIKYGLVNLNQFIKDALSQECMKQIGKELLQVIAKVIKDSISGELNIEYIILKLLDILSMSLD